MHRASSTSLGLCSSCPPAHSTIGSCDDSMLKRSTSVFAHESRAGIEQLVGLPVARQESRESQHVRVAGAAHDQRTRDAALKQTHAAQNQRAHDALAELGLGHEDVAEPR